MGVTKSMSATGPVLVAKLRNAAEATRLFVRALRAEGQRGWAEHFSEVASLLEAGAARAAVELHQSKQRGGVGSLSDIYPENGQFEKLWGQCSSAIGNLRLYLEYGIDRPLVEVSP